MRIVSMREDHIGAVAMLEHACFSTPWTEINLAEELGRSDAVFLVAENDVFDAVCGYVGCHFVLDEGYITNVAVLPDCRRHGIAKCLIEQLLELAEERKLSFVTLEVRASNLPAIALYQKMGFQEVGKRPGFYSAPQEDAVLMTRSLETKMPVAVQVRFIDVSSQDFQRMTKALDDFFRMRFGALADCYEHDLSAAGAVAVAYRNEQAIGAGCWCACDAVTAEIKRLFVVPEARRSGTATALLVALEVHAAENGCHRMILETGTVMTDAIALYEKTGYHRISNYGIYVGDLNVICFEKNLGENAK